MAVAPAAPPPGGAVGGRSTRRVLTAPASVCVSAASACLAVLWSNMFETVKTRLQLDGEGAAATRQYRGVVHATAAIFRAEGLRGLQSGLGAALGYQALMNGLRLGCYEPVLRAYRAAAGPREPGAEASAGASAGDVALRAAAGASSGALAAAVASPLYLVKNRLQAESAHFAARERHGYTGLAHGLRTVWAREGLRGLFRGVDGAIPRVMVGSAVQLTTYDTARAALAARTDWPPGGLATTLAAAAVSSLVTVTAMNPLDVVSTRLYQSGGRATSYAGPLDCARQTWRAEGITAFFKGWSAQYLRLGPHTVLCFVALEALKPLVLRIDAFTVEVANTG